MRRIVARQHQAGRLAARHEGAVDAVDEARAVEVLIERLQHLIGGLGVVLQGLRPGFEIGGAGRRHGSYPPDALRNHGTGDALRLGLQHAEDEGPTDALAVQVALVDPQVVEQGDVVGQGSCANRPGR